MSKAERGVAAVVQPWTVRASAVRAALARPIDVDDAFVSTLRALMGSRLIVWVAGLTTLAVFGRNSEVISVYDPTRATAPFHVGWVNFVFAPAARWDSVWYLQIAHLGYFSRISSAYFPLYPLLIRIGAIPLGSELVAGLLISVGSMIIGLYLLYLLTRLDLGEPAARTAMLLMAFFPMAFFLSAVYTESLFLMLSVGAIYAARRDRWGLASGLGGLAAASRSNGILILVPLVVLYLYGPRLRARSPSAGPRWRPAYEPSRSMLWLLLVPVGLVAYLAYMWFTKHAPLAPFQVQAFWGRTYAGPFGAVWHSALALPHDVQRIVSGKVILVNPGDPVSGTAHDLIDLSFVVVAAAWLASSWRLVPTAYVLYALVMLAETLAYPPPDDALKSFPRYMLVIFPLFMGRAARLADRPVARRVTLVVSAALLTGFSGLWAYWGWVA